MKTKAILLTVLLVFVVVYTGVTIYGTQTAERDASMGILSSIRLSTVK